MYFCFACQSYFKTPHIITDVENDEQYETCKYCKSDDFELLKERKNTMYVSLEQKNNNQWQDVTLRDECGNIRKLFMTIKFENAINKMNEWRRKYLNNNTPLNSN